MSKVLRLVVASGVGVTLLALGLLLSSRESAHAQGRSNAPVVVLSGSVDDALERAYALPANWPYDPASRTIHPENASLVFPVRLSDEQWLSLLPSTEYYILRQHGTERAFTHELNHNTRQGIYYSRATGQPLFRSEDKYDSGTGWPSYTRPINADAIVYIEDNSLWSRRIEVVDSLSGSHLGHVFPDGPLPTRQRYCINGAALVFVAYGEDPPPVLQEIRQAIARSAGATAHAAP